MWEQKTSRKNTRDLKWLSGTRVKSELWYTAIIILLFFFSCVCVKGDYYLLLHWSIACTRRRRRRTGLARMCRFFRVFIWFHQNDICKSKYAYTRQNYQTACFFTLFNWWECGMEKPKRCRRHAEKLTNSEISGAHMCVKCADREQ